MVQYTVKLGYNELGYNERIFQSQVVILLHKSTRLWPFVITEFDCISFLLFK